MNEIYSPFVKFTYTLVDLHGMPQQKSWIVNLACVVSIESISSTDLKIFLNNNQVLFVDLGQDYNASDVMNNLLDWSAVGEDYNVYKLDSYEKK
jgi:hypothetical protein